MIKAVHLFVTKTERILLHPFFHRRNIKISRILKSFIDTKHNYKTKSFDYILGPNRFSPRLAIRIKIFFIYPLKAHLKLGITTMLYIG